MDQNQDDIRTNKYLVHKVDSNRSKSGLDEPDELPRDLSISYWDLIVLVLAIVSHVIDVCIDFNIAYQYYIYEKLTYFLLTVIFIAVPSIINTYMSLKIYSIQEDMQRTTQKLLSNRLLLPFLLILQMAPVLRYYDVLKYALKSHRAARKGNFDDQKNYYALMAKEDSYVSLLRIFECFLEAVPQQILQICIVLVEKKQGSTFQIVHQSASIASSTIGIAWAMASYHKNVRIAYENRKNIGNTGTVLQFLWHIMITVSRILSISLAAIVWPQSTGIFCMVHWLFMTLWIFKFQNVTFCIPSNRSEESKIMRFFFSTILGLVYIFTYLSPSEGQGNSKNRYLGYYGVFLVENIVAVTIWANTGTDQSQWYYYLLMIGSIAPFFVGILFMAIYYKFFHPHTTYKDNNVES
ncbi:XK-related protein 6 [Rhopalosiphum maidis]|uniref:XK-related protein 6 n=1 Tax=Rhopalosiphum maidis TaxID=43146 RepID=UPI000EFE6BA7|nr:XK-related protein 6 [Rhopalosiphum maidis]